MTEFGVTTETLAKWSELSQLGVDVDAEDANTFGLRFLLVAASVWVVGFGLTKASGEK